MVTLSTLAFAGKTIKQKRVLLPSTIPPLDIPEDEELAEQQPQLPPPQRPTVSDGQLQRVIAILFPAIILQNASLCCQIPIDCPEIAYLFLAHALLVTMSWSCLKMLQKGRYHELM